MPDAARLWTCTTCSREYEAEPLRCECGEREFARVDVIILGVAPTEALGLRVIAEIERRSASSLARNGLPKPRRHGPRR